MASQARVRRQCLKHPLAPTSMPFRCHFESFFASRSKFQRLEFRGYDSFSHAGDALGGASHSLAPLSTTSQAPCGWVPSYLQDAFTFALGRGHMRLHFKRAATFSRVASRRGVVSGRPPPAALCSRARPPLCPLATPYHTCACALARRTYTPSTRPRPCAAATPQAPTRP